MLDSTHISYSLNSHAYRVFNKKLMTVETNKYEQAAAKINTDEDDQNIFLKNLDSNT